MPPSSHISVLRTDWMGATGPLSTGHARRAAAAAEPAPPQGGRTEPPVPAHCRAQQSALMCKWLAHHVPNSVSTAFHGCRSTRAGRHTTAAHGGDELQLACLCAAGVPAGGHAAAASIRWGGETLQHRAPRMGSLRACLLPFCTGPCHQGRTSASAGWHAAAPAALQHACCFHLSRHVASNLPQATMCDPMPCLCSLGTAAESA